MTENEIGKIVVDYAYQVHKEGIRQRVYKFQE